MASMEASEEGERERDMLEKQLEEVSDEASRLQVRNISLTFFNSPHVHQSPIHLTLTHHPIIRLAHPSPGITYGLVIVSDPCH